MCMHTQMQTCMDTHNVNNISLLDVDTNLLTFSNKSLNIDIPLKRTAIVTSIAIKSIVNYTNPFNYRRIQSLHLSSYETVDEGRLSYIRVTCTTSNKSYNLADMSYCNATLNARWLFCAYFELNSSHESF